VKKRLSGALLFAAAFQMMVGLAEAASCGNTGEGFEAWKSTFADEAQTNGTSQKAISALMSTSYSSGTIAADRSQKSFALSLDAFMAKRGAAAIAAKGKSLKATNAALFASIENAFGVPAGPLIAIWGVKTDDARPIEALSRFRPIRFSSTLCKSWDGAEHKQPKPTPTVGASSPPVIPRIGICDHNAASPSRSFGGANPLAGFLYSGFDDCWWLGGRFRCDLGGGGATYG
jgi:hypothetical protein